jgi:putative addiction module killer protein
MEVKKQKVLEYITESGNNPFREWMKSLKDSKTRAIIHKRITRVRLGLFGDMKPLDQGVFELRINHGPGYRIYFGRDGDTLVILLCGGSKKTQRTDVEKATDYFRDYKGR